MIVLHTKKSYVIDLHTLRGKKSASIFNLYVK